MKYILAVLMLALSVNAHAQDKNAHVNYDAWATVLKKYVNEEGLVNYKLLKKNPKELNIFINQVENIDVSQLSDEQAKAFWINAYNAITLHVVTDKYPVRGIRWINFGLVWEVPRSVAQDKKSLGDIEHKILRPMGDPRIHFAINCASIGCPKLPTKPFFPETLDDQLEAETIRFINDPEKVRLDRGKKILYYSAIFDWFEEDFLISSKDIKTYIMKYINIEDRKFLAENSVKLKTLDYDWGLNEQ